MKKNMNKGFMLAETLVVTAFVAGVLIYLFIQFTNLNKNYNNSYNYNTVEGLYSLRNIRYYILNDSYALTQIETSLSTESYIDITNCDLFSETNYCLKLFELEHVDKIIVTTNNFDKDLFSTYNTKFQEFISKINSQGTDKYRLLVEFNNGAYATIRFGE